MKSSPHALRCQSHKDSDLGAGQEMKRLFSEEPSPGNSLSSSQPSGTLKIALIRTITHVRVTSACLTSIVLIAPSDRSSTRCVPIVFYRVVSLVAIRLLALWVRPVAENSGRDRHGDYSELHTRKVDHSGLSKCRTTGGWSPMWNA